MRLLHAFRDLPLFSKLLGVIFLPLVIMLSVTLIWTVNSLNRLEADVSASRLRDEINVFYQQFARLEADLNMVARRLSTDPSVIKAMEQTDQNLLNATLISERSRLGLGHLQIVDALGKTFGVEHHGHWPGYDDSIEQLHGLGLLEINDAGLISNGDEWMLVVVQPIKTPTELLGALSVGFVLDRQALSELNFDRTDPSWMIFDEQVLVNALSGSYLGRYDRGSETEALHVEDHQLLARANDQQIELTTTEIDGKRHQIAYAPLMLRDKPVAVLGVALTSAATDEIRSSLVSASMIVTGLVALVTLAGGFFLARIISRPILKLKNAAEDIAMLKLDTRIDIESHDEVGSLASSFNFMTEELQRLYSGLKDEVAERTQTNERLTDEIVERQRAEEELRTLALNLERSNTELQQFASIASHDLQEPLRKIRTFGARLQDGAKNQLTDKHRDYLDRLLNAAGRMQILINDLLIYSRVTTKANPFVSVDLNVIAKEVLTDQEVTIEEASAYVELKPVLLQALALKSLDFKVNNITWEDEFSPDLPRTLADEQQLLQVFLNILSNAEQACQGSNGVESQEVV